MSPGPAMNTDRCGPLSYRLHIVAPTVFDVVNKAGGYIFDRGMAGWKVTVTLLEPADDRPLVILGADIAELESTLEPTYPEQCVQALAVCADLYGRDSRLRGVVREAAQVLLWDQPGDVRGTVSVQHRLSSAARLFKAAALQAAGNPEAVAGAIERFRTPAPALTA